MEVITFLFGENLLLLLFIESSLISDISTVVAYHTIDVLDEQCITLLRVQRTALFVEDKLSSLEESNPTVARYLKGETRFSHHREWLRRTVDR